MGQVATWPLPPGGSPPFQSGGQNQKWPTSGPGGYITPAAWGVPTVSEQGAESEVAHKWARWLHGPCRLGGPHRFRAGGRIRSGARWLHNPYRLGGPHRFRVGGRIRSGPQVGQVATWPLPPGGSPLFQSGGQNQKWPTSGPGGYITPAAWGVPTVSEQGAESEVAHKWARWLHGPCRLGGPHRFRAGGRIRSGARWLHNPYRLGGPHRFRAGGRIRSGPQVGQVATWPLPPGGSPLFQSGGQNQKWPTSGPGGYITPAAWRVQTVSEQGAESEVAHKWARWLHNPYRLGGPHRFRAGGRIRSGPQVGKVATWPLPPGGSPPLQSGESEVAHKWARWLHNPYRLGGPHRFKAVGRIRSGGSQKRKILFFGGHTTKRGFQSGGTISEIAHKWAQWQSEVGKLIFWVGHLGYLVKFFFY